jgi:lipoprotein-releasing system ATP-binding protein
MQPSPKSKVQSPKSEDSASTPGVHELDAQAAEADFGLWTLGFGPHSDFGLIVSDLRKSFASPTGERIEVLRGAAFSATAGEAVAIIGSSGAGKSTLLHVLGGLEEADHGTIVAGQFSVDRASPSALAHFRNQRVGFVFQFHHLLPDLTAAENVSLPLLIARTHHREALLRGRQMLAEVGLDSRASASLVGHLSGGEQQRVAVCRALITRPTLVLADEPTGNLDAAIGDEIARSLVSYARKTGAIVIIATHNLRLAEICDRTLVLRDGRLL